MDDNRTLSREELTLSGLSFLAVASLVRVGLGNTLVRILGQSAAILATGRSKPTTRG